MALNASQNFVRNKLVEINNDASALHSKIVAAKSAFAQPENTATQAIEDVSLLESDLEAAMSLLEHAIGVYNDAEGAQG
jgi:hypothetical protein